MTKPELSSLLKSWRASRNFTQHQAAESIGVPVKTFREWEQARHLPGGLALRAVLQAIETPETETNLA